MFKVQKINDKKILKEGRKKDPLYRIAKLGVTSDFSLGTTPTVRE